jgi:hypothetical protein
MASEPTSEADPGVPTDVPIGAAGKGVNDDRIRARAYLIGSTKAALKGATSTIGSALSGSSTASPNLRVDACWQL